jgi:hypothetical protein
MSAKHVNWFSFLSNPKQDEIIIQYQRYGSYVLSSVIPLSSSDITGPRSSASHTRLSGVASGADQETTSDSYGGSGMCRMTSAVITLENNSNINRRSS